MRILILLASVVTPSLSFATLVAPSSLIATATSGTSIKLTWSDSNTTESGFSIERGLDGCPFGLIGSTATNVTSYTSGGLSSGVRYYYRVRAVDSGNKTSPYSNTASAVTLDTLAPSVPSGLVASAVSCSQINVSWSGSIDTGGSGLRGYNLFRNGAFVKQILAPATSASDTGLAGTTTYSYTVSSFDNAGNQSPQSGPVS